MTGNPGARLAGPARWEALSLALVLTVTVSSVSRWTPIQQLWARNVGGLKALPSHWYASLVFLAVGLVLTFATARRSGLRIGTIADHWKKVLLVCGSSVAATAIVFPLLPVRPWGNAPVTMWLVSPIAQSLIFIGYLYGLLQQAFPGYVHARVPVERGLVLTVCFFALWHLPNFWSLPPNYVVFQLFYTSVLAIVPGLSRQWTGSILYAAVTHMAINFIAWYAS